MKILTLTQAKRVATERDRQKVLTVPMFPASDLERDDVAWFIATRRDEPAGVLRVNYDPSIEQYRKYGLNPIDATLAIDDFIATERIAEIGR
jgi:hypothetical protein